MKSFKQMVESIVDEPRRSYAKDVFDKANTENPKLKKSVKNAILSGVRKFEQIAPSLKHRVIGGILTKQYNNESDIDVNVLFDVPAGQRGMVHKKLRKKAAEVNGKSVSGTKHPINYFVLVSDEAYDLANQMADNVYDLEKDEFEKKSVIRPIDLDDYMSEFEGKVSKVDILTGELRRDVIDYASLKRLSRKDVKNLGLKVKAKLEEIEDNIQALISTHKEIKSERMGAFLKKLTPAKLRKYGSQNALPKNVIYKLMEKYYYLQFFLELEKIIGDDKQLSPKEADKVIDATQKFGFSPIGNPESDSSEN